jgi:hypothetical protein
MQKRHSNTGKGVQCEQQDLKPKGARGSYHQKKNGDVWLFDLWLVEMVKAHDGAQE